MKHKKHRVASRAVRLNENAFEIVAEWVKYTEWPASKVASMLVWAANNDQAKSAMETLTREAASRTVLRVAAKKAAAIRRGERKA